MDKPIGDSDCSSRAYGWTTIKRIARRMRVKLTLINEQSKKASNTNIALARVLPCGPCTKSRSAPALRGSDLLKLREFSRFARRNQTHEQHTALDLRQAGGL
jgi:hypothetical protein